MGPAHHTEGNERPDNRWKGALVGFLAVAGFFLWTEHRAHLLGILPYLLVLACPLIHIFHHGGHGRGHRRHGAGDDADAGRQGPTSGDTS